MKYPLEISLMVMFVSNSHVEDPAPMIKRVKMQARLVLSFLMMIRSEPINHITLDQGSGAKIMYPNLYMGLELKPEDYCLDGKTIVPKGMIKLPVQVGSRVVEVNFIVVDAYSPYTAILAKPWVHTMEDVSSTLHLKGYNQIPLALADHEKNAFVTPTGNYHYKVMHFRLKNAGSIYQRMMTKMFESQLGKNIEVYIDDMVVKRKIVAEHLSDFGSVFEVLRKYKLHLNASKCSFSVSSGKFLGYMVTHRGIEVNPGQIKAINDLQPPRNPKEVQKLTGMTAALNRFISCSADKCKPFFHLLHKWKGFEWNEECALAFQQLKDYLSRPPIMSRPKKEEILFAYIVVASHAISLGSGVGLVIVSPDRITIEKSLMLGFSAMNNEAEYKALLVGVPMVKKMGGKTVEIFSDSRLVIRQWNHFWKSCTREYVEVIRGADRYHIGLLPKGVGGPVCKKRRKRPFPKAMGNRIWLLVRTDYFTKWVEAKPLSNIRDIDAKKFVWKNIVTRFGIPHALILDNKLQFNSKAFRRYCCEFVIRNKYSTPVYLQGNGQAKVVNKIIVNGLKKRLDEA
ncbi:uncharacterized protein LOC142616319 [Castanea sativa]|uniref:uncharacterized protein LOC142616319 n=1 Tax=Castanea sativa TaxID=21020 RepID=UPI003F651424